MIIKNAETSKVTESHNAVGSGPIPSRAMTTANGNLWVAVARQNSPMEFWVRRRGGQWTRARQRLDAAPGAFRIDEDDNAHYVHIRRGRLYYHRGTPNADRTEWTWSSAETLHTVSGIGAPDFVVHKEGTGWAIHVVMNRHTATTTQVTEETQEEVQVTDAVAIYRTEHEWHALTTESSSWDPTPEYPADEWWRGGHDHFVTRWSVSHSISPFTPTEDASHAHTLSGFTGSRNHGHTIWSEGAPTGNTRRVYSHTDYQTTTETRTVYNIRNVTTYGIMVVYVRADISSTGEVVSTVEDVISPVYSVNRATRPSIALRHSGDDKTVDTTPDLFVAWSAGRSGAAYGIRLKKATYATGAWTWGDDQQIDDGFVLSSDNWVKCIFDGTRVLVGGLWRKGSNDQLIIKERDVADTLTTTLHTSPLYPLSGAGQKYIRGAFSYDSWGNIYIIGVQNNAPLVNSSSPIYSVWDRSLGAMDETDIRVGIPSSNKVTGQILMKLGDSHAAIDWFYNVYPSPWPFFHERFELVNKPLRTKVGGTFIKGEIAHREGGQFLRGTIYSKRAGAFNVPV